MCVCECDDITDFDVKILEKARSAVDVALLEARCIGRGGPQLNRRAVMNWVSGE